MIKSKILGLSLILNFILLIIIPLIIYYLQPEKENRKPTANKPENHFFEFGKKQSIHVLINGDDGLLDYNDNYGSISIGWKDGDSNVIYKLKDGDYSFLVDKNRDGFVDVGAMRSTNERFRFSQNKLPFKDDINQK